MVKTTELLTAAKQNDTLHIEAYEGEAVGFATARSILAPQFRHAMTASQVNKTLFGAMDGAPGFADYAESIKATGDKATAGDLAFASRMLAAQAVTLDTIFTEMARVMALNMGEYLGATETFARIAMKAQAQSRAALETLAKLHQPREQTVRHVHVNEGGQAVIADQFHHHESATKLGRLSDGAKSDSNVAVQNEPGGTLQQGMSHKLSPA